LQIVDELMDAWSRGDLRAVLERLHPQCEVRGDRVLVAMRQRARGKGSGVEIEEPRYQLFTFRDGKVFRFEEYSDEADALNALGS